MAPAFEVLVLTTMDFVASKNSASVEVADGFAKLPSLREGVDVGLTTVEVDEEDLVVDTVEVGMTRLPAVMVTAWLPRRSEPPLVKVVVALAAVEVIVPNVPSRDLLHSPWSDAVMTHPTSTVLAGSSDAVGRWEYL